MPRYVLAVGTEKFRRRVRQRGGVEGTFAHPQIPFMSARVSTMEGEREANAPANFEIGRYVLGLGKITGFRS